jgi:hypothetical protein
MPITLTSWQVPICFVPVIDGKEERTSGVDLQQSTTRNKNIENVATPIRYGKASPNLGDNSVSAEEAATADQMPAAASSSLQLSAYSLFNDAEARKVGRGTSMWPLR